MMPAPDLGQAVGQRLRERQRSMPVRLLPAPQPISDNIEMMRVGGPTTDDLTDMVPVRAKAITVELAFLFGQPDTEAIRQLAERHAYFDECTGDTWDLFFPGYYESEQPRRAGDVAVTTGLAQWWFGAPEFETMRRKVEGKSGSRWAYSGGADLLLVPTRVPATGPPVVAWDRLRGARLGVSEGGDDLGAAVASVIGDIERGSVVKLPNSPDDSSFGRDLASGTLAGVITGILTALPGLIGNSL